MLRWSRIFRFFSGMTISTEGSENANWAENDFLQKRTFHCTSKIPFQLMILGMIGNENNRDESICAMLESLDQQLLALHVHPLHRKKIVRGEHLLHSAQQGVNNIWKSRSQYLRLSCYGRIAWAENDDCITYFKVNTIFKWLKALCAARKRNKHRRIS